MEAFVHFGAAHAVEEEKIELDAQASRTARWPAMRTSRPLLLLYISLLALIFNTPVGAATTTGAATFPKPGTYCQSPDTLLVTAEELSASLDLVMSSRAALSNNDRATAINQLAAAGTTMHLSASRGAAARTIMLIDAILQSKKGKDYAQMLTWFPLLHSSLLTLPDDAKVNAADDLIGRAEDSMQRIEDGDPLDYLGKARHMLACDDLDIPLQAAIQAQGRLLIRLGQQVLPKTSDYDILLESLRDALSYTLQRNEK